MGKTPDCEAGKKFVGKTDTKINKRYLEVKEVGEY